MRYPLTLGLPAMLLALPGAAVAQDVEMLGERYGTRPPASYYEEMARDPGAFEFLRGRSRRLRLQTSREGGSGDGGIIARALGPRDGPVEGVFRVPVLLGLFQNSPATPPYTAGAIEGAYFGPQDWTIPHYYDEVSGGRVELVGDVQDWQRIEQADTTITDGENGLFAASVGGGGAGNFVWGVLERQPAGFDWGLYDNDGPDGLPNSGDDDGFVDVVALIQPTRGGECGGSDNIWSHRWSLSSAVYQPFVTTTPRAGSAGEFILIDDYTIQPARACSGGGLNPIGVFVHELGHAFGLPDLYDTFDGDGRHAGAGSWDLMSSGSYGCNNANASVPCHMGAWSKERLGWATVVTLAADADHGVVTLPPVSSSDTIFRVDANDGSGEYFLLENRRRVGYDQLLYREGLLVWQIDPDWIQGVVPCDEGMASRWACNRVNGYDHMGVWLRQADGLDQLHISSASRGDAGDPFPGTTGNTAFHASSNPAATSYEGGATGVTLIDITEAGGDVTFRLLTRFSTITVRATGTASPNGLFTVDGAAVDPPETTFASAPFQQRVVEAAAGEAIAVGERRPFLEWADDPGQPRVRTFSTPLTDLELVAQYGGAQYELDFTMTGGVGGVEPATLLTTPPSGDLWFDVDATVELELVPLQGFDFLGWTGSLAGASNPTSLTMSAPVTAGAALELVYAVPSVSLPVTATEEQSIQLEVVDGTAPYVWRAVDGTLPAGLRLSGSGLVSGAAIELGSFDVTFRAVDANGLPADGVITLEVTAPAIPIEALASPFLLTGPALTQPQRDFLDRQGNGVAGYDIGDFRAWVLANPDLPLTATLWDSADGPRVVTIPMRFDERSDPERRK